MSFNKENAVYISKPSPKNSRQSYIIYPDHVELRFKLFFTTLNIPFYKIVSIQIVPPAFRKDKNVKFIAWFWGFFLDWGAFHRHVMIETKSYFARYIHFTPDNPEAFMEALKFILNNKSLLTHKVKKE